MKKYTLQEIEKVYTDCGINPKRMPIEDVKAKNIPNILSLGQKVNCDINTATTKINRKL